MDFETQISLLMKAPPKISTSKTAFEKYKPRGLFSEFYGNLDSGKAENENDFFYLSVFLFDLFLCAFYPPEKVLILFSQY